MIMKKYFIAGLVLLLPVTITLLIVGFAIRLLTNPFMNLVSSFLADLQIVNHGFLFLSPEQLLRFTSQFLILISLFFFTIILGMLARWFFIHTLVRAGDHLVHKIPLINKVYKTTQDVVKTIFASDKNSFKQVVLTPFEGGYMLGLISGEAPQECSLLSGDALVSVLIPITPNPMTGFLAMFKRSDLIPLSMKPEDAVKYIVSCGVIVPDPSLFSSMPPSTEKTLPQ